MGFLSILLLKWEINSRLKCHYNTQTNKAKTISDMCLKPGELPEKLYVQGRVRGRSQEETEILCLILYLIVGRGKMNFHQSDSLNKEWSMTACAFI